MKTGKSLPYKCKQTKFVKYLKPIELLSDDSFWLTWVRNIFMKWKKVQMLTKYWWIIHPYLSVKNLPIPPFSCHWLLEGNFRTKICFELETNTVEMDMAHYTLPLDLFYHNATFSMFRTIIHYLWTKICFLFLHFSWDSSWGWIIGAQECNNLSLFMSQISSPVSSCA